MRAEEQGAIQRHNFAPMVSLAVSVLVHHDFVS